MARWSPRSRRQLVAALPRLKRALRPALHRLCSHREGCGGVKGAVRRIQRSLPRARYVARFDIAAYYNSVRHDCNNAIMRIKVTSTHCVISPAGKVQSAK